MSFVTARSVCFAADLVRGHHLLCRSANSCLHRQTYSPCVRTASSSSNGNGNGTNLKIKEDLMSGEQQKQVEAQFMRNEQAGSSFTELVRDFLEPAEFYNVLGKHKFDFFCGVPDSLLKDFCAYVTDHTPAKRHLITANEGGAIAVAGGYHLATGKSAVVYLQNSGLGNMVNPLMSLTAQDVYSLPMLILCGWRGEPGKKDEPQHLVQGSATPGLLASMRIPFQVLPDYIEGAEQAIQTARQYVDSSNAPYCLLVRRQTFLPYKLKTNIDPPVLPPLTREAAMMKVVDALGESDAVVSSTGMLSRELFEYRAAKGDTHGKDFLTVGSMGHASSIALGIALSKPYRRVFCLDGDGAAIMHLGSMSTIAQNGPGNLKHIVINNGAHDSVGGQPTDARDSETFNFGQIAQAVGYKKVLPAVSEPDDIVKAVQEMRHSCGPSFLEIKVRKGNRKNLGRPTRSPTQNKKDFMEFLQM